MWHNHAASHLSLSYANAGNGVQDDGPMKSKMKSFYMIIDKATRTFLIFAIMFR